MVTHRDLSDLQFYVWKYRMARFPRDRRSLAMRIRWKLRRLASGPDYDVALAVVQRLDEATRCAGCGTVVRRRSRLLL